MLLNLFVSLFLWLVFFVAILAHRHARYSLLVCFSYNSKCRLLLHLDWFVFDRTTKKIEIFMYMPLWMCENKKLISLSLYHSVSSLRVRFFLCADLSFLWSRKKQHQFISACVFVAVIVVLLLIRLETLIWYVYSVVLCVFPSPRRQANGERKSKSLPDDSQEISSRSLYRCKFIFSVSVSTKSISSHSLSDSMSTSRTIFFSRSRSCSLSVSVVFLSADEHTKANLLLYLLFFIFLPSESINPLWARDFTERIHTIVQKKTTMN